MNMLVCLTVTCDNYPANLTDDKAGGEKLACHVIDRLGAERCLFLFTKSPRSSLPGAVGQGGGQVYEELQQINLELSLEDLSESRRQTSFFNRLASEELLSHRGTIVSHIPAADWWVSSVGPALCCCRQHTHSPGEYKEAE